MGIGLAAHRRDITAEALADALTSFEEDERMVYISRPTCCGEPR